MARARKSLYISLGALMVMATLWGCNGSDIDDPDKSDSVLIVDDVSPAAVQADVSPDLDPNGVLPPTPPDDDSVTVDVRNLNRTTTPPSAFGDILITAYDIECDGSTLQQLGAGSTTDLPASLTVPAGTSASITVVVAQGTYKSFFSGFLLGLSDRCRITFKGEDLSGQEILAREAVFSISYVDAP